MEPFDHSPTDTRVLFGRGRLQELGEATAALGSGSVLLVVDPGIVAAGLAARAERALTTSGLEVVVFDGVEENPTSRHVSDGVEMARRAPDVGVIVGLGGGSAMDCAKGINFLFTNGGRMEDYWGDGKATAPMLPSIGVPTTAGTGSEAQRYALIARESDHQKMACGDEKARFRTVILDAQLLDTAPRGVVAAAAADALAHAVESFVCTRANPVSRLFAREAFRLLHRPMAAWVGAQASPDDGDDMLLGAHWAGAAIDSSMLGAAHACANPLTGRYGITHGVAVGMMLPHVIRFNGEATDAYAELAAMADSAGASGATAAESVALRVEELNGAAALPAGLRDLDVPSRDLSSLAEAAVGQKTAVFNPRPIGVAECLELYRAAY